MHRLYECARSARITSFGLLAAFSVTGLFADEAPQQITWQADYAGAVDQAKQQGKMMFVFFYEPRDNGLRDTFEMISLVEPAVVEKLQEMVCVRLPVDVQIPSQGGKLALMEHSSFRGLLGEQGIAILDFASRDAKYFACVVDTFPFTRDRCYSARQLLVILNLPAGTPQSRREAYAQRTLSEERIAEVANGGAGNRERGPSGANCWQCDFDQAVEQAKLEHKRLLIFLHNPRRFLFCRRFELDILGAPSVQERLADYVCVRLPLNTLITFKDKTLPAIDHPEFGEMRGEPGVAILDFVDEQTEYFGDVVSTFPMTRRFSYTSQQMVTILGLPPGTLTQRTLVYAVRTHPEHPKSTDGEIHPTLLREAKKHSAHQARIRRQGHHQWESRFHQINGKMPMGLTASEVCAESWPGESMIDAAIECVRCWRHSSGHWRKVRSQYDYYGYDMQRGPNGVWYATGIFSGR